MKNNKGITLIALVVTIIIIIILASVSISIILGDNGILTRAKLTKDILRAEELKEAIQLEVLYNSMTDHVGGTKVTKSQLIEKLYSEDKLTSDEVDLLKNSDTITINDIVIDFSDLSDTVSIPNVNEIKISNSQIYDCQRSPSFPNAGDSLRTWSFIEAYKANANSSTGIEQNHYLKITYLGKMNDLSDNELKQNLMSRYSGSNYPVVRLDEYDGNDTLIGKFSEGGILYAIDSQNGIYVLLAQQVGDATNSYAYIFCTKNSWPQEYINLIQNSNEIQSTIEGIVGNFN